jgi:hypothetical protein
MQEVIPNSEGYGERDPPTLGKNQPDPKCQDGYQRGPQLIPPPQEVVFDMQGHFLSNINENSVGSSQALHDTKRRLNFDTDSTPQLPD